MAERHQVIIVGGGPVGVGLGVELGLRGIDCVVVERRKELARIPKGQNLTPRTLEHFYFWGIVDEVRAARLMPKDYPIGELTTYQTLLSDYWWGPQRTQPGGGFIRPHYYEDNDRMPQYQLEAVMRRKITELPTVKMVFERTVKRVDQDTGGVRVTLDSQTWPYDDEVLEAEYVVGCDGSRSLVREQLGIEQAGTNFEQRMALVVLRSPALHALLERFPRASLYRVLDPAFKGYPIVIGRVIVGETFFLLAPVPNDAQRESLDFPGLVDRAAGTSVDAEFEYTGFWDLRVSIAKDYQVGRGFIAGDAAHSHPPFGGFGLNNGLEDIRNLGWKLAARLQGWGGDALLASYSEERRPIFWEVGEDFIARGMEREGAFLARYSPERDKAEFERAWKEFAQSGGNRSLVYEPHYEGSSVVVGPPGARCSAHGQFSFKARPGHHLSPQPLSGGRYLPEELGSGFSLLALGVGREQVRPFEDAARSLGMPLNVIADSYDSGRQRYESRLVLVRPDHHVVWVGEVAPDDAAALFRKVTGRYP